MSFASGFKRSALVAALIAIYGSGPRMAYANPQGAMVANGQASLVTQGGKLTVTNTPGAIINWQSFSIGAGETTYFQQQSAASAVLNRVQTQNPSLKSQIDGTLGSNGRVFLLNPNGIVFGAGSVIDTQGFVASTLNMNDEDFKAGKYKFFGGTGAGGIEAQGRISSGSGDVYLVAPNIGVDGKAVISSEGGNIVLAAGEMVEITGRNLNDIKFEVQSKDNKAINLGTLSGGAVGVFAGTLSHSGAIKAQNLALEGGKIVLKASDGLAAIERGAVIDASGSQGGNVLVKASKLLQEGVIRADGLTARGGSISLEAQSRLIQTSAATVSAQGVSGGGDITLAVSTDPAGSANLFSSATLDASATQGTGGSVTVLGRDITLAAAHLIANGDSAGGTIRVGGGRAGADASISNAQNVVANAATSLEANARVAGDGGTVVAWADGTNRFAGNLEARGGSQGGDGGFIEVSGKLETQFAGMANASAPDGRPGTFLLDPKNILIKASAAVPGVSVELLDPNPGTNDFFGSSLQVLSNGNILVFNATDDLAATNSGAIYLFNGTTGGLISNLRGSAANDQAGSGGVAYALSGDNWLIRSPQWNASAGALTTINSTTGVSGQISAANSLVGSAAGDQVGSGGVQLLTSGKLAIRSPNWNGASGAITWADGTSGITGTISTANSLTGDTAGDQVGNGFLSSLGSNKYYFRSANWHGGKGAVTWFDASAPTTGTVSAANSLVGSSATDQVGSGGIVNLFNGKVMVFSPDWNSSSGAVTWLDQAAGTFGTVDATNSLVGSTPGDQVGGFANYTFVGSKIAIGSPNWTNTATSASNAGAITWVNAATGAVGFIDPTPVTGNSLVGSNSGDAVGSNGVSSFGNGHYYVRTSSWENNAGAVTWIDGGSPLVGTIDATNSLVGSTANDQVGSGGIVNIGSGKSLVFSPSWNNGGSAAAAGAVTWFDQAAGTFGNVSAANSLVGSSPNDQVGGSGNYAFFGSKIAIFSPSWDNVTVTNAGAITWADPATGFAGAVSPANSLVGGNVSDQVGSNSSITYLDGTHYAVVTPAWNSSAGAITWFDGASPTVGAISAGNSLVGGTANDRIGAGGFDNLGNGKSLVFSPYWNGLRGAVTWFDHASGTMGTVGAGNSLVGSTLSDQVGGFGNYTFVNSKIAIYSPNWTNPLTSAASAGAVTWADAATGIVGILDGTPTGNSLVGTSANDDVGASGVSFFNNGNFYVFSSAWNSGAGAITWIDPNAPAVGPVTSTNSLVGASAGDQVGTGGIAELNNGKSAIFSPNWNGNRGAVTWFDQTTGTFGTVGAGNSLVGTTANDRVGGFQNMSFIGSNVAIRSPNWTNTLTAAANAGAITWADAFSGITGTVDGTAVTGNSLVGTHVNDGVGTNLISSFGGTRYYTTTNAWNSAAGAVTWIDSTAPVVGSFDGTNSLVGGNANDQVGVNGIYAMGSGKHLIFSPYWNTNRGAVTLFDQAAAPVGLVSASNSLVGSTTGDLVGSSYWATYGGKIAVLSPNWNNGGAAAAAGAVTWVDLASTLTGAVSAANSLVGGTANDRVGNNGINFLSATKSAVRSGNWNGNAGAITWIDNASPTVGLVSGANSLTGANSGDAVGSNGLSFLANGDYYVISPNFNGSAGAVSVGKVSSPTLGAISAANSLTGQSAGDGYGSSVTQLSSSRLLIRASNADSNGLSNNGRIHIYSGGGTTGGGSLGTQTFASSASSDITITPDQITAMLNTGTAVVLQANNDITLDLASDIIANNLLGNGGNLTLQAGRSVLVNSNITTDNANLTIIANDRTANGVSAANRDAGTAEITMANGTLLDAGTGDVDLQLRDGAGHSGANDSASYINVRSVTANNLSIRTDFGGLKVGDPAATLPSDIKLTGNADVIATTKILFAGGAPGAFARLSADKQITIDPPSLELRPGQSFVTIVNPTRQFPIKLIVSDCINCNFTSPYEISGATFTNGNSINAALLSLNLNPLDDIGFSKKSKGDIEIEAGETCK